MSTQCDKCDKPATVHLIEIRDGQKVEKHLCEEHALEEGVKVQVTNAPINELLKNFVVKHSGKEPAPTELRCEGCGLTWSEFRRAGLLGCPSCYVAFEAALMPLLERAHEGAADHLGKVPDSAGVSELRQHRLMQLRRQLDEAVANEEYEKAAQLRDEVERLEADTS